MSDDGKLDLILDEVSRIRNDITAIRLEYKNDMKGVRDDAQLCHSKISKIEQRQDDTEKLRDRHVANFDEKAQEIYEDINGAKNSLLSTIERNGKEWEKTMAAQTEHIKQWVKVWVYAGIISILVTVVGFFAIRTYDKIETASQIKQVESFQGRVHR